MNEESSEKLKILIAKLTLKYNYWGYLFSRIRRKAVEDLPSIMGVCPEPDGTISLCYQPELVQSTEDKELEFVLSHEGFHLLNKHITRSIRLISNEINPRQKQSKISIWNIATDCCVNVQAKIPKVLKIGGRLIEPCRPELYNLPEGKASEFYYYRLLDNEKKAQDAGGTFSNNLEELSDNLDDHSSWSEINEVTDLSSLSRKIETYVGKIVQESVKTFNRHRGKFPQNVEELITEILKPPKAPYYQIIRKLVRASKLSKFKRSPTRLNRKRGYVFTLSESLNIPVISPFPGKSRDYSFSIVLLLDTSGSMSKDDILEGLSGIKNIIENDRHCEITVLENDTNLQKEYKVKRIREIQFNVIGRGGTILRPGLERARVLNPDVCLAFTDGETDDINNIPRKLIPKKLIWVIQKNGTINNVNKTGFIVRI